ncbi:hypothetical protein KFU94_70465 [Chloroflexi bacterium TSY]|nr:hypothetical protein [Chloroflexi bacterium TSY]
MKIRGFRIELGEIEAALDSHPNIYESVVLAREYESGDKRLVAYVVPHEGQTLLADDLRQYLKARLPDYMVPTAYVLLDAMPLTPNGKINRKALPAPDTEQLALTSTFMAPRTPNEQLITDLWAEVLSVKQVGIHDNFFELGGHSLASIQIMVRLQDTFQTKLPIQQLFETPTVASLAQVIATGQDKEFGMQAPPLVSVSHDSSLPLSYAQERIWLLEQLASSAPPYRSAVRLQGPVNESVLRQCLNEIVQRHAIFRTTFVSVDGRPTQVIAPMLTLSIPKSDLDDLPAAEQIAEAQRLVIALSQKPFDLTQGPLLRVHLLRFAEEDWGLLMSTPQIIYDGLSGNIFMQELIALYEAFSQGRPSPLPELPIQYADYAAWQRQWLKDDVLKEQLAYWQQQLDALPVLELSTVRSNSDQNAMSTTAQGMSHHFTVPDSLAEAIQDLSRSADATLFMTLLAAYKMMLAGYTALDDIVVGSPSGNRTHTETEGLIGRFMQPLVLRTDLTGNPSFSTVLERVRKMCLEAYARPPRSTF